MADGDSKQGGHCLRNLAIGCAGLIAAVTLLAIFLLAVAGSGSQGTSGSSSRSPNPPCHPRPCAELEGFQLTVTEVNRNAAIADTRAEAGNHFVTMKVTLSNESRQKRTANPIDFKLRDAVGQEHGITLAAPPCEGWQAVDLIPGASVGPKLLCFQAAGDPSRPLVLIWSPGLFAPRIEIPL